MLLLDELKIKYKELGEKFEPLKEAANVAGLKARLREVEIAQQAPDLYSDLKLAQKLGGEAKFLETKITFVEGLAAKLADIDEFISLAEAESDEEIISEIESLLKSAEIEVQQLHLQTLLRGEYDSCGAILALHAGAGGTEAQDWVSMLYRMYRMYCERQGLSVSEIDRLDGEEAGIKSVTFAVRGMNAYGYLKAEKGVHRLVRISPFDSNARRHTSFASLEVMPEIENENEIKINPEDLRVDRYRSGGAGGQHVNKTDSAVRITHIPTGIVVQCQNERSQIQNRETAMKLLMGKLVEMRERENAEKVNEIKGEIKKIEWGSQIRSYVFQPYTLVKDHRTGFENSDIQSVMNGDIEGFIFDYLRKAG